MSLPRRHRQLATWVTLLALVLATLAPGMARALAVAQGDLAPWGQVCSANGNSSSQPAQTPADTVAHLLDHCPFCSLHSDTLDLPPSPLTVAEAQPLGHALPWLFLQAPRTLHVWASAQARAPPLAC
jgi:hypothetical protein